jgi:hypothetical protein
MGFFFLPFLILGVLIKFPRNAKGFVSFIFVFKFIPPPPTPYNTPIHRRTLFLISFPHQVSISLRIRYMLKNAFNYISSYHLILIFFFFFFWIFWLFFFGRSDNRALSHFIFQKYLFIYFSLSLALGFVPPPGRILKWFPNCFPVKYGFLFIFYILLGRFDIYYYLFTHSTLHTHTQDIYILTHYTLHYTPTTHRQTTGKGGDQLNLYTTLTYYI